MTPELNTSLPAASKAWTIPARKLKPIGLRRLPNSFTCATLPSWGRTTSMNGALRLLAASPTAVNQEVAVLPSMALVGGERGEKVLAVTVVAGRRARFAPPGFVGLARPKSAGVPS